MKELMMRDNVSLDRQVDKYIDWLENVPALAHSEIDTNPKSVVSVLRKIEVMEISAKKMKVTEITKKAATTKLELIREVGKYLSKSVKKGKNAEGILKTLGLTKNESSLFQRVGEIEDYHWTYAIDRLPTLSSMVREYERAVKLREVIEKNRVKDVDGKLHEFILSGLSPFYAELALKNDGSDNDDDEFDDHDENANDEGTHDVPDSKKVRANSMKYNMEILPENIKDLIENIDPLIKFIKSIDAISKKDYNSIVESSRALNDKVSAYMSAVKALKERFK